MMNNAKKYFLCDTVYTSVYHGVTINTM